MNKGRRYNKGKRRYALIPPEPLGYLADVYTKGAHKYTIYEDEEGKQFLGKDFPFNEAIKYKVVDDGADNWRKGLKWMEAIDSVERHIQAFKSGEDVDEDLGTLHLANAAWGLFSILEFYKTHPELDDRQHSYLNHPKIGLDIDDVICNWTGAWAEKFGHPPVKSWKFSYNTYENFKSFNDEELREFYLNLPPKISPDDIPFEPHCYITARSVPTELTEKWIEKHGFPTAPVHSVGFGESKVKVAKESGIDVFVDDNFSNFVELNKAGICTYLLSTEHNKRYNVGYKRINSLKELFERFK